MTAEPELKAVLFDMDGTLVDSEKIWGVALTELAARYGGVLSDAARRAIVGTAAMETMRILLDDIGQPWRDPHEGARWLDARTLELFADGLEWLPGAFELVTAVRADGLPTALVTNTARPLVEVALDTLGRHNFDVVVCGNEVPKAKPDPAPYLAAVTALGVAPANCVVIEDSVSGIMSARAAGCTVVAVPQNGTVVADPDVAVFQSLLEVDLSLLRTLVRATVR